MLPVMRCSRSGIFWTDDRNLGWSCGFFRETPGACAILGNHEDKHIQILAGEMKGAVSQRIAMAQIGDEWPEVVEWFSGLPLQTERFGCTIVHAGWDQDLPRGG